MNNVNGILLVIAAMAAFTLEDMFIKQLTASVAPGQILVVLGLICAGVFFCMALFSRQRIFVAVAWQPLPMIRAMAEAVSAVAFVTALSMVDLSMVAAVFQAMPLAVTMGAALFLGEHVGWRRWSAIGVGFIGVLMIIRPGLEGFRPESLFVVVAVIGVAARDLITRRLDPRISSAVVSSQAYLALVVGGAVLMILGAHPLEPLQAGQIGPYAGAVVFGVLGYYGIVTAMRVGEASAVTPFRYTRLLFSILAGVLVFNERPDLMTLAGSTLIIGSGLYTFIRERRLARDMAMAAA
ncbi:DMT family transporter [uncultured Ruegeria sp.]|uniref:DMT family transporter n=1 Tax=uncultured Ruegeria sp. TaxID=259304 RepID=UPI00262662DA|nr:DMT family transporter [uncultured Ruegeria sp.]